MKTLTGLIQSCATVHKFSEQGMSAKITYKNLALILLFILSTNLISADDNNHHKMQVFKNAHKTELDSLNVEGVNAYLSDVIGSHDPKSPISCGLFRMEQGPPLEYTYTYDEAKIIIDGEMTISEDGGASFDAVAGDVVYFAKGAKITFTSKSSGTGFYCGQRAFEKI